jgi:DNA-binding NarL/FixJ family response regulator
MKEGSKVNPIRVAIVDDVQEVRDGLKYLLNLDDRIHVGRTYSTSEALLEAMKTGPPPDIVLMDIGLPGMSGIEATRAVKELYPRVNVLMLTIFEEEEKILASIRSGADGYILKNNRPDQLIEQIKSAREGGSPISPTVARRLLAEIQKEKRHNLVSEYGLTPREKEILKDVVDGYTYKEIAEKHGIAGSTSKKHILHIYQKLNVTSKAQIVRKAIDENLA